MIDVWIIRATMIKSFKLFYGQHTPSLDGKLNLLSIYRKFERQGLPSLEGKINLLSICTSSKDRVCLLLIKY